MLHAMFQDNRISGILNVFTIYGHAGHLDHVTLPFKQTFVPLSMGATHEILL